ncbi:hypothetical protein SNEBB_007294 [Seison nebaliae]|nr:hypothetical protein SNEBB_007294 [Seison nebaliae]
MTDAKGIQEDVQKYYGDTLKSSKDLRVVTCELTNKLSKDNVALYKSLHEDVREKNYGCGIVYPQFVDNCKIIDLGSGSGCDCYMLSKMVGENGTILGVDMIPEQISLSKKYIDFHTKLFGFKKPNTNFIQDTIENFVKNKDIGKNFFDVAVSNCVINLVADKKLALQNIFSVLNEGGEFYFSDMYANINLPKFDNPIMWGEGISGALYWKKFIEIAEEIGFTTPLMMSAAPIPVEDEEFKKILDPIGAKYVAITYRLFKPKKIGTKLEKNKNLKYIGDGSLKIDCYNTVKKNQIIKPLPELYEILNGSRYAKFFENSENSEIDQTIVRTSLMVDPFEFIKVNESKPACCSK